MSGPERLSQSTSTSSKRSRKLLVEQETIEHEELEELFDGPRPAPTLIGPPIGQPAARVDKDESEGRDFSGPGRLTPQPAD